MEQRKRALVTGGATGIGRAAVLHLARAGYDIGLNYHTSGDPARAFAVNVRGLFLVTRASVPLLRKGRNPCIVNTASIVGLRPGPQPLSYAASKAAVVALTKTLAGTLGPDIRVNAVAPGWMEGEWIRRMLKDKYQDLMGKRAKATPLKRCVTAEDVAETMMSLVQSNRFVTGEVIVIDGGFSSST